MHTPVLCCGLSKRRGHFHRLLLDGKLESLDGWKLIGKRVLAHSPETCSVISARAYPTRKLTQLYSRRVRKFVKYPIELGIKFFLCEYLSQRVCKGRLGNGNLLAIRSRVIFEFLLIRRTTKR